jgi:hypothetical protein
MTACYVIYNNFNPPPPPLYIVIILNISAFLIKNGSFLIRKSLFLIRNNSFLIKKSLFLIKKSLFLIRKSPLLIRKIVARGNNRRYPQAGGRLRGGVCNTARRAWSAAEHKQGKEKP